MYDFPILLFRKTKILSIEDCTPRHIDGMRILYGSALQAFRLEVACYPTGMVVRTLSVRYDKERQGIGRCVVETLKELCIERQYEEILLETVLETGEKFWVAQGFTLTEFGGYWKCPS